MSNGGAGKGKVVAGVFIGMVLGIAAAGGVAWYLAEKKPAFTNKEPSKPAPQVQVAPLVASAPVAATAPTAAASGVGETKQHFEFYKVLTDKSDGTAHKNTAKPAPKPKEPVVAKPQPTPPAISKELYYVQAGSFQNVGDAEKLKAKLAFSGFEANIQTANIPDKGEWHRVRLGPYSGSEAGKTIAALKQNGIIATQIHAQ
jgi:cell division protein FtsN